MPGVCLKEWIPQIRVLEQMLNDRGYSQVRLVLNGHEPLLLCSCFDNKEGTVHVYITEENKVGVKTLRRFKDESKRAKCTSVILLCPNGLTPFAQKEMNAEEDACIRVEVFRRPELSFNVTRHSLVPPHVPLSPAGKKRLLAGLGSKATSLPKIKDSDPVIKYLGLAPGTVVAIRRCFGALEADQYYRIVVA